MKCSVLFLLLISRYVSDDRTSVDHYHYRPMYTVGTREFPPLLRVVLSNDQHHTRITTFMWNINKV